MAKFEIILGGNVSADSVNESILKIENKIAPLKLKVELDLGNVQNQINEISNKFSQALSNKKESSQKGALVSQSDFDDIVGKDNVAEYVETLDKSGKLLSLRTKEIQDLNTVVQKHYSVSTKGEIELSTQVKKTTTDLKEREKQIKKQQQEEEKARKKQEQARARELASLDKLKNTNNQTIQSTQKLIADYSGQANASVAKIKRFNSELSKISTINDEIAKRDALKNLNREINQAAKYSGLLGQSLESAMVKYVTWLGIATVVAKITNAFKDLVNQVIELDKAFTSLQIVTGYTDTQMQKLKESYIALAKEMGVTVDTVVSGADEWLRAGLSVKETNEALKASLVLSTVAQMDSATATQYLVAAMNGFHLQASELIDVVDKLSAVDIVAATSSEELGQALSYSANSAQLAGLTLDKYIGMLATVSETTRQSASTIGNSFRSIFTRLQKVKIGAEFDDEGESISDVDTVLKQYGIDLMKVSDNLNDMGKLLDVLGEKWDGFTTAQQSQIATTIAGNYQRERFLVLMGNYDRALELEQVSLESNGSAMEKYAIQQQSIAAQINRLSTAWTELASVTVESDIVKWVVQFAQAVVELSTRTGGLVNSVLLLASTLGLVKGLVQYFKAQKIMKELSGIKDTIDSIDMAQKAAISSATKWKLALGAIGAVISIVWGTVSAIINARNEARERELSLINSQIEDTNSQIESLHELRNEYIELSNITDKTESQNNSLIKMKEKLISLYGEEAEGLDLVNGAYENQIAVLDKLEQTTLQKQKTQYETQRNILAQQIKEQQAGVGTSWYKATLEGSSSRDMSERVEQIVSEYQAIDDIVEKYEFLQKTYNELMEKKNTVGVDKREQYAIDRISEELQAESELIEKYKETLDTYNSIIDKLEYYSTELPQAVGSLAKEVADFLGNKSLKEQAGLLDDIQSKIDNILSDPAYEKNKAAIDEIVEAWKKQADVVRNTDFALEALNDKLKALQKQKQLEDEELATQEKLLKVEQARAELAKAQEQRISVFRAGKGFVYEEDAEAIQKANESYQKALQDANQTDIEKAISAIQELQEMYNQAQLDQAAAGKDDLRKSFLNQEFLAQWMEWGIAEKKAYLDSFITTRNWNEKIKAEDVSSWVPKNAQGTTNFAGGATWVGENGPEIVNLPKGTEILSNSNSKRLMNILSQPRGNLSPSKEGHILQFNGPLNFPNVTNETDAKGFVSALVKLGENKIINF